MFKTLTTVLAQSSERARHRREYLAILRLDPHLIRDIGLGRSEIHARLDALGVPR